MKKILILLLLVICGMGVASTYTLKAENTSKIVIADEVDGKYSYMNLAGDITIEGIIKGSGLTGIESVHIKAGSTLTQATLKNESDIQVGFEASFLAQTLPVGSDYPLEIVINRTLSDEETLPLLTSDSTIANDSAEIDGKSTFISVDENNQIHIGANGSGGGGVDPQITTVDGKDTTVDADGTVNIVGEFTGYNLDKIGDVKFKLDTSINQATIIEQNATYMRAELTLDSSILPKGSKYLVSFITDRGAVTELNGTLTSSVDLDEQSQPVLDKVTYARVDELMGVIVGATGLLNVEDQQVTPTYQLDGTVSAKDLVTDAGIIVTGGTPEYSYAGTVDTSTVGDLQTTTIVVRDSSDPYMQINFTVEYNVVNDDGGLSATSQTNIPTYDLNQSVSVEQFLSDAGIVISGGTEPYTIYGVIDTSVEGNMKPVQLVVTDSSDPVQTLVLNVFYNVEVGVTGEIIGVLGLKHNATVKYTYTGNPEEAYLIAQNNTTGQTWTNSDVIDTTEQGVDYLPFKALGTGDTTFYLMYNDVILDTYNLHILDIYDANKFFMPYANDGRLPVFDSNNNTELTQRSGDDIKYKNRGWYSTYQLDTSKPIFIDGSYRCDGNDLVTGDGKGFVFYDSQTREQPGGTGGNMGIINQDGSTYADHGITVTADSYNDGHDDQAEINAVGDSDGSDSPRHLSTTSTGHPRGFWTKDVHKNFDVEWEPYTEEFSAEFSGKITGYIGSPKGDEDSEDQVIVSYDVPRTTFPQGYYWLKFNATTGTRTMLAQIQINDIEGTWVF